MPMRDDILFPKDYTQARNIFLSFKDNFDKVKVKYELKTEAITSKHKTDILIVDSPEESNKNVLLVSTGLHGIEGYMGNIFLQILVDYYIKNELYYRFSLIMVHAINPWGMDEFRRVNENNVDLNRNFIENWNSHDKGINSQYGEVYDLLNPDKAIKRSDTSLIPFLFSNIGKIKRFGTEKIKKALTLGQYEFDKGIYYGGAEYQKSVLIIRRIFKNILSEYINIMHFDIHTGAGPKNRMSVINSVREIKSDDLIRSETGYDLIYRSDEDDFYEICGDINDYFYFLKKDMDVNSNFFYSTCLEFGTFGESIIGYLKTLKSIINENSAFFNEYVSVEAERRGKKDFLSLFYPSDSAWRNAAIYDAEKAIRLFTEYFIKSC